MYFVFFFFFQAEDGIRDLIVTGVQTCALPISHIGCNLQSPTYSHPDDKSTTQLPEGSPVLILQGAIPKDPRTPTFLVEICGTPMLFVEIWTGQPNPRAAGTV